MAPKVSLDLGHVALSKKKSYLILCWLVTFFIISASQMAIPFSFFCASSTFLMNLKCKTNNVG
jgi:hypothetical protein